jgi:hypothetical protein
LTALRPAWHALWRLAGCRPPEAANFIRWKEPQGRRATDGEAQLHRRAATRGAEALQPEPTVQQASRTLTLDANKNKVKKGKKVTLSSQVNEIVRQGPCESGQTVQLQRKKPSQASFTTVEQLQTNAAGNFTTKEKVKKTFQYRAQVGETATCAGQTSNTEKVKVKKKK